MMFTLTRNLTFAQGGELLVAKIERMHAKLYRRLMKRLKAVNKKPLVKALFKFNAAVERSLKILMKAAHEIEKTWAYRLSGFLTTICVRAVKQDGLVLTILLTTLGYFAGCYFIL